MTRRTIPAVYGRSPAAWKTLAATLVGLAVAFGADLEGEQAVALVTAVPVVAGFLGLTKRRSRRRRSIPVE